MKQPQVTFCVQRRDTGDTVVRAVRVAQASALRKEATRAARFAAWRLGVACWARAEIGSGRVLYVGLPQDVHVLAPLRWGERLLCPFPGCPHHFWAEGYCTPWNSKLHRPWSEVARLHVEEEHVLCGCNRFYTLEGWAKHKGQVRRGDRVTAHVEPLFCMRLRGGKSVGTR